MKLFKNFIIGCCVAASKDPRTSFCDINELSLPAHAEKWDCAGASDQYVPTATKCFMKCDDGFIATSCNFHVLVLDI